MTGSAFSEGDAVEASVQVTASDHSVAIGRVEKVENLHVNVESLRLILQHAAGAAVGDGVRDAVATADAVLLGPLASTDAQGLLNRANDSAAEDPAGALALYREVQHLLVTAGFPGHAAQYDSTVAALCVRAGEEGTAIRLLMDALWAAERTGNSLRADRAVNMLRTLAEFPDFGPTEGQVPSTPALGAAFAIADFVSDHLHAPVPSLIELPSDAIALAASVDRARAVLFAAERALGDDDLDWINTHREQIELAATEISGSDINVAVRLRITVAEATDDWSALIRSARNEMPRDLKALTLARYARHRLLQAAPDDADSAWRDAIREACLAERHADAADWLYSQRFVANRFRGIGEDTWHPLAQALSDLPSQPKIVTGALDVRERALSALHYKKERVAAINLRRQLLDSVRSASLHDELEARRLLGEHYRSTGNLALAAYYTIGGGDYEEVPSVAADFGDTFHDVIELIKSPLSWVAASAFQFATAQADLIPDGDLETYVGLAIEAIGDVFSGRRLESPILSPQVYLSAYGLIAALAERLSETHARAVLDMLADAVEVPEHTSRRTDESHITIAAGVVKTHSGELATLALNQLTGLFERAPYDFGTSARAALEANLDLIRDRLHAMADRGHRDADALIGYIDPDNIPPERAQAAAERLKRPTRNNANHIGTGVNAVNDSLLARVLSVEERVACIDTLLTNAASPWEPSSNRDSYLIAASNLTKDVDEDVRLRFFNTATQFASDPPPSHADALNASMNNPLGAVRVNDRSDSRPAAVFLAARLAKSVEERRIVRDAALRLIGAGTDDDYRVTKALQLVQSEIGDYIGLLAQGSWPLRSLAAILWAESLHAPVQLGIALSQDRDSRVRVALARAMTAVNRRQDVEVRDILLRDPRWTVRSIAQQVPDRQLD